MKDIERSYKEYCKKVDPDNKLSYNGWYSAWRQGKISIDQMHTYIKKENRPMGKGYIEYKNLCTDCEPFNLQGFRIYKNKGWSIDQILELTRKDIYVYRPHMTKLKPKSKKAISVTKTSDSLLEIIRRKRIELGHPIT